MMTSVLRQLMMENSCLCKSPRRALKDTIPIYIYINIYIYICAYAEETDDRGKVNGSAVMDMPPALRNLTGEVLGKENRLFQSQMHLL